MKRCPECRREYDVSMSVCLDDGQPLSFCLQDGATLIFGSAADELETAILAGDATSGAATKTFEPAANSGESFQQIARAIPKRIHSRYSRLDPG
jgi:hypothetical protein